MTTATLAMLISFASFCFAVWIGLKGDKRTDVKDIEERTKENTRINFKLDEISNTTREIKNDVTSMRTDINLHNDRLIKVEESCKQAHKRIDLIDHKLIGKEERHEAGIHKTMG